MRIIATTVVTTLFNNADKPIFLQSRLQHLRIARELAEVCLH